MSDSLRILLLGPPQILVDGKPLALSRRGLRSLVYYLACQEEAQSRDHLGLVLWDGQTDSQIRKNLRENLSRLRGELMDKSLVQTISGYVQMDPRRVSSDVRDFLSLYHQAARLITRIPGNGPLPEGVVDLIQRALNLWRGARFEPNADLSGPTELEAWARDLGRQVNRARQDLLEHLAEHENAVGNTDSAVMRLRAALLLDPLSDLTHIRLAEMLERSGRLSEAFSVCQSARELYDQEAFPFPHELDVISQRLHGKLGQQPVYQGKPAPHASLQLPMIGRESEMEALRQAYRHCPAAAVLGEAGAGKTRLLRDFGLACQPGVRWLAAMGQPEGKRIPFQPLADMLRGGLGPADWAALPKSWQSVLALLLPELCDLLPDLTPQASPIFSPAMLMEAIYQALRLAAKEQKLFIFLDNAQWFDESTLETLLYLLEKGLFGNSVFLALAARQEEMDAVLERFLLRLEGEFAGTLLRLRPLDEDSVRQIAALVFDGARAKEMAPRLHRDTGGNILHILETLRMMLEFPQDQLASGGDARVPLARSIYSLVRERLQRLSAQAQDALALAAVVGSEFSLDLVASAGRLDEERVVELVEEISRAQLIRAVGSAALLPENEPAVEPPVSANRYQFIQEQVRDVLLMDMSPARRGLAHLRVAEALRAQDIDVPGARAAVVAGHYQQAGRKRDAFGAWMQAGAHAGRLFSLAEAAAAYEQAEKILEQDAFAFTNEQLIELYVSLIELGMRHEQSAFARRAGEALLRHGRLREDHEMACAGYLGISLAAEMEHNIAEGIRWLERARPYLADDRSPGGRVLFHLAHGRLQLMAGRLSQAIEAFETGVNTAEKVKRDDRLLETLATGYFWFSGALLLNGWPEKALAAVDKSLDFSRLAMNLDTKTRATAAKGLIYLYLSHLQASSEQTSVALHMAETMRSIPLIARCSVNRAHWAIVQGELDEGWKHSARALEVNRSGKESQLVEVQARWIQGDILRFLGAYEPALVFYDQSAKFASSSYHRLDVLYRRGLGLVGAGRAEMALEVLAQCTALCREGEFGLQLLEAQAAQAHTLAALGRFDEALHLAEEVSTQAAERQIPFLRGIGFAIQAQRALNLNQFADARQKALALVQHARGIQNRFMEIGGLVMALRADEWQDPARLRLAELLALVDQSVSEPALRPHVEHFINRARSLASAAGGFHFS